MKKTREILALVCAFFIIISFAFPACAEPDDAESSAVLNGSHSVDGRKPVMGTNVLVSNAQAALLYEVSTDTLMYAQNADAQLFPSSFVKIMTALIAIEEGNLSDQVIVDEEVLSTVPSTAASAKLVAGEVLTLEDLLYCMMVGSANDAAAVIADHVGGSQSAFVEKMNQYASDLGCTGTYYVNAHGLHNALQLTTARDMGKILSRAIKNETFSTIWGADAYTVPATNKSEERKLETGNYLMSKATVQSYFDERVTGGRTGVIETGERSIASSAEANGMQMICVVIGAKSQLSEDGKRTQVYGGYGETATLLDAAFSGYRKAQLLYEGQVLRQCAVEGGTNDVTLGCRINAGTILPESVELTELSYQYHDLTDALKAPIQEGQVLSTLDIWYHDVSVAQAQLYAMNQVALKAADTQVEEKPEEGTNLGMRLLKAALVVIVLILLILLGIRGVRIARHIRSKKRENKYRKYRGRSR